MARRTAASYSEVCQDEDLDLDLAIQKDGSDSLGESGEAAGAGSKKSWEERRRASDAQREDLWRQGSSIVNPKVWWRHPGCRILVTYIIMGLDFYIFVEDPVQDSHVDYTFIGIGQLYHLVVTWPDEAWECVLRVAVIFFVSLFGVIFARQVIHHMILRDCLKISMFGFSKRGSEAQLEKLQTNKGTTFIMGLTQLLLLCFFIPFICNLLETGTLTEPLTSKTGRHFAWWGKIWQYISVGLDVITITMVSDLCLQDTKQYPDWAAGLKHIWNDWWDGCVRMTVQWILAPLCLGLLYYGIHSSGYDVTHECEYVSNDMCRDPKISVTSRGLNMGNVWLGGSSISFRVLVACTCAICDILNLVQDWDFPTFDHGPEMNQLLVPFTKLEKIEISCFKGCSIKSCASEKTRKFLEKLLTFEMTAKWFAYMSVWGSLCADLSCMRTQFTYVPSNYGQYVDAATQRVWNIVDPHWLSLAYKDGYLIPERAHLITWSARKDPSNPYYNETSATSDILLSSRYADSPWRYVAIVPGPLAVALFAVLVWRGDVHLSRRWHGLAHYPRAPSLSCPWLTSEDSDEELVMDADGEAAEELKEGVEEGVAP